MARLAETYRANKVAPRTAVHIAHHKHSRRGAKLRERIAREPGFKWLVAGVPPYHAVAARKENKARANAKAAATTKEVSEISRSMREAKLPSILIGRIDN